MRKLSKTLIKSKIPKKYYNCTRANGISLNIGSYSFGYCGDKIHRILTASDSPILKILERYFKVTYEKHFWMHYDTFIVKLK